MGCDVDGGRMQEKIPLMQQQIPFGCFRKCQGRGPAPAPQGTGLGWREEAEPPPHSGWNLIQATVLKPNSQLRVCAGAGH